VDNSQEKFFSAVLSNEKLLDKIICEKNGKNHFFR